MGYSEFAWGDIGRKKALFTIDDFHGLNLEWHLAVLWERPDDVIEANEGFGSVEGSYLYEHISGVYRYLGVFTVDDRWDWANHIIAIEY